MATKIASILPYILSDDTMNDTLEAIKNNTFSDTITNKVFYGRLKNVNINDAVESKREDYKRRIKYLMDNIPLENKHEIPLQQALNGNFEKLIDILEGWEQSSNRTNKNRGKVPHPRKISERQKKFKSFLNKHPKKSEFLSYVNANEKLKNSIVGKTLGLTNSTGKEIKQRSDIIDNYAIEYIEYIMTTRDIKGPNKRIELFPKDSQNKKFEPIVNLTKLFPALNFLLKNKELNENFNWKNEAPDKRRQDMVIRRLTKNMGVKDATGVQGLFNSIVRQQKSNRTGLEDTPDMISSSGSSVGRFRYIDKFFLALNTNKNVDAKKEYNDMINNIKTPSKAIAESDWELILNYLKPKEDGKIPSKVKASLRKRLELSNILAIEKVRDIDRIFDTKQKKTDENEKIKAFEGMGRGKTARLEIGDEQEYSRRVKNQSDLLLLEDLFYIEKTPSEIIMIVADTEQYKNAKTFLTDGKFNASKEELPDILEFLEEVEEAYHNSPYVEGDDTHKVKDAFRLIDNASNKEEFINNELISPLEIALEKVLQICYEQYGEIRKSFINAIKDSMVEASKLNTNDAVMNWFEDKNLLE